MIDAGRLKRCQTACGAGDTSFEIHYLEKSHLPQILALQDVILGRLSRSDLLEAFAPAFMEAHLGAKGFILGTFVGDRLVAFRNVYFPDLNDREWNLGYDIGLETVDDLTRVANLQMVCVHPDFRGNALGWRMNAHAIHIVRRLGRFTHLCATVSPYNYWNIRTLLRSGFTIRKLKPKYNGKLRYVVYQHLTRPLDLSATNGRVSVRLTDIARQEELIRKGLIGVELTEVPGFCARKRSDYAGGFELVFASPHQADSGSGRPGRSGLSRNEGETPVMDKGR